MWHGHRQRLLGIMVEAKNLNFQESGDFWASLFGENTRYGPGFSKYGSNSFWHFIYDIGVN